ncbi:hypothetical protein [Enterocloster bolteae]|uniref:hypothetical protein n=1 Tax=Enterocloster bolteae TaxID=208479 RepID=UPI002A832C51|nr:hypothetical protein [Enterocloster bolteae]
MSLVAMKQPYLLQVMYDDEPLNPRTDYDNFGKMVCWHSRYNLGDEHDFEDTNELLKSLARDSVEPDALISLVRSGKVEGVKLEYNQSDGGWTVSEYDDYFKKWFTTFFEGSMADNKQDIFEDILNTLPDQLLYALASEKNLILPLNLYDHSGLSMSVSSFIGRAQHAEWDSGQVGWIYATADSIRAEYGNCSAESVEKAKALLKSEVETYNYYLSGQCYGFRLYENGEEMDSCWGFLGALQDVLKEIVGEVLPESHRDMVDHLHEVSDTVTRAKGYEDFIEDLEEMEEA